MGLHVRACRQQFLDHHQRGRFAHVVGARLERQSPDGESAAGDIFAEILLDPIDQHALLLVINSVSRFEEAEVEVLHRPHYESAPARLSESTNRRSRRQETGIAFRSADPIPMPRRTSLISAPTASHRFAIWLINEIRIASIALEAYLVSSADRGCITSKGLSVRRNERMDLAQNRRRLLAGRTDHDAVGTHEVFNRRSFFEELRDRADIDPMGHAMRSTNSRTLSLVPTGTVLFIAIM